jgi:tRNA 5-methylaminomethyl-2-thiouridine biosynthesis bifunctional protein
MAADGDGDDDDDNAALRALWRARPRCTVFDARPGAGGALLDAWRRDPARGARLHVIALAHPALPGFARMPQADACCTLDLVHAPLPAALGQLVARIDLFLLPAASGMDDADAVARALARLAALDARLVLCGSAQPAGTAAGAAFVAALAKHGFQFEADGRNARFVSRKPRPPLPPVPQRRAIVLGAGLAGSAACERLCARGWAVTLVERHARPAREASGNRAGIFMPLVSKDDNVPTRLTRAAYLFALRHWALLGGVGAGGAIDGAACGVLQLARDARHAGVQRAIANAGVLPPDFARWLERPEAEALLGVPAPDGGWLFPHGGWARPGSVCEVLLAACGDRLATRFGVGDVTIERMVEWETDGAAADGVAADGAAADGAAAGAARGGWIVRDAAGMMVAQAPTLILANGAGALDVPHAARLPLTVMRGQVTHVPAALLPALPLVLCREAYLTPAFDGFCSAGATYDADPDPALSAASQHENLARLRALLGDPHAAHDLPLQGRVGFRCIAPDRLPLVGRLPDFDAAGATERLRDVPRHPGLFGLLGLASRGLIWAGLAAELLAAQIEGEPLPLEAALADALDPARFVLRARRAPRGRIATGVDI